ncbi:MAG: hypothetical protein JOZ60_11895 [Verrucomicrobia bacterium]|nr:hypothetical protein [Verrucomicrobiota bacterium]
MKTSVGSIGHPCRKGWCAQYLLHWRLRAWFNTFLFIVNGSKDHVTVLKTALHLSFHLLLLSLENGIAGAEETS